VEGERVGPETEWIGLRSGRRSTANISVGTRFKPSACSPVSHRSEAGSIVTAKTPRAFREAIAWGKDESVVLSRPGNRLRTAEAGRVIVFGERTFRFVVCRFPVRGIVRRSFCGGWR